MSADEVRKFATDIKTSLTDEEGQMQRPASVCRDWLSTDPSAPFPYESGRYILFGNYLCPWATRALILRSMKKLEDDVEIFLTEGHLSEEDGWVFPENTPDPIFGTKGLKHLYRAAYPDYANNKGARYTVPALLDKKTKKIVNNESSEIIQMFNAWPGKAQVGGELYPNTLKDEIDEINEYVYDRINNGVYKTGFATRQAAYTENCLRLFEGLDRIELLLGENGGRDYLIGPGKGVLTLADIRLYTTLSRFDVAYHYSFRCNLKRIRDYPNLFRYLKQLYAIPQFKENTKLDAIKAGYAHSALRVMDHELIVPLGPSNPLD